MICNQYGKKAAQDADLQIGVHYGLDHIHLLRYAINAIYLFLLGNKMQLIIFLVLLFIMFFGFFSGAFLAGIAALVGMVGMCIGIENEKS